MEEPKVQSAFKLMGTILGMIIIIVGLGLAIYALTNPLFYSLIFYGLVGIAIGIIIVYAARRLE